MRYSIIIFLLANYLFTTNVLAESALCKPFIETVPNRPELSPPTDESLQLFADEVQIKEKLGLSTFTGKVILQRADQILSTPTISYDRNQDIIDTEEEFIFWGKNFIINGSAIKLYPEKRSEIENANYWLLDRRIRGHAAKLIQESEDIFHLEQASYTTCDADNEVWNLFAEKMTLDRNTSEGTAHNITINILDIPVFYFPYISFPIGNQRKSGFLAPNIGSSDEAGTEFSIPYYLNLAPNYDATITPRYMSRRGLLLETEFRYLTPKNTGRLELEYIPYDQAFGDNRSSALFQHNGFINKRWITELNINYTSDRRFFEELGTNISVASIIHLERRGDLRYIGDGWQALGRLQTFQTLDPNPAAQPYHRLPQFLVQTTLPKRNRQFNFGLKAEWVQFERNIEIMDAPTGRRIDVQPTISFPWRTPGTFIQPKLSLRYTIYDLDNLTTTDNKSPDRFLGTFSTDSGLFFERDLNLANTNFIQTLEPRLFYRYTPYKDQTNIPIFDTAEYDLSFLQLFRDNNFAGSDRVDDAHQISFGISSRLLETTNGMEYFRASLGQAYYFKERRVTLPEQLEKLDASSNIILELATQLSKQWQITSTMRWNPHENETEHSVLRVRYRPDKKRIFNLSYRLREQILEQTDLSFHWLVNSRWNVLGRWNYSMPTEKFLDSFLGIEYQSCCWAVRAITRRYINKIDGDGYLNGFFLQFHLKGLGSVGKNANSFLEQGIPGYNDQF